MTFSLFTITAAFMAGLASFFSPCLLPLVPIYLAQIIGHSIYHSDAVNHSSRERFNTFLHAVMFVLGFTLIFVALGATASALGRFLTLYQQQLRQIGGIILILIGLHLMGVLRMPFLLWQKRLEFVPARPHFAASLLTGSIFALGWTPCISLLLSSILGLAANAQTLQEGILLLFVYSAGLGIPFLLLGLGLNQFQHFLTWLKPHLKVIEVGSGLMIVLTGILIIFHMLTYINAFFPTFGS